MEQMLSRLRVVTANDADERWGEGDLSCARLLERENLAVVDAQELPQMLA